MFTHRRKRKFHAIDVFFCLSAILKEIKEKGKEVLRKKEKKKLHQKEERKVKEEEKIISACILVSLCKVVMLLARTKSRMHLGRRHRLAWDYFSGLQF